MLRLVNRPDDIPIASSVGVTKSGLQVPVVVVVQGSGARAVAAREHPRLVRVTHWLNAIFLIVMTMSGLEIFAAFPSFGAKMPQSDLMEVPEALRLGGWLGGALQWHYTFAWLFASTGLAYLGYLASNGHWRRVVLQRHELTGIWPMMRHYVLFKAKPEPREPYNPLQKLAYTIAILVAILSVLTGVLLAKPIQFGAIVTAVGGFPALRVYHFAAMIGLVGFVAGHLVMVAAHGWRNFASMWTGWKSHPDYLCDR